MSMKKGQHIFGTVKVGEDVYKRQFQRNTEQPEQSTTCGFTEQE